MRYSVITILIIGLFISGCVPRQIALQNKFDEQMTKNLYEQSGKNTINGSGFLRQNGGGVVTCAGSEVGLIPYTPFSEERIMQIYGSTNGGFAPPFKMNVAFSENPSQYFEYRKKEFCDASGNFTFEKVADGKYFIQTTIFWTVGAYDRNGGGVARPIEVKGGEVKKVILSQ